MQIVIDIPEDVYTRLFDNGIQDNEIAVDDVCEMARALRLGTPLPVGHGRLIDEKELGDTIARMWENRKLTNTKYNTFLGILDYIPTIVEADRGDGNGND